MSSSSHNFGSFKEIVSPSKLNIALVFNIFLNLVFKANVISALFIIRSSSSIAYLTSFIKAPPIPPWSSRVILSSSYLSSIFARPKEVVLFSSFLNSLLVHATLTAARQPNGMGVVSKNNPEGSVSRYSANACSPPNVLFLMYLYVVSNIAHIKENLYQVAFYHLNSIFLDRL